MSNNLRNQDGSLKTNATKEQMMSLYGWGEPAPEGRRDNYYEVVALLVAAGATVDAKWLADPNREMLGEKVRADRRMVEALSGKMHR
jgi:hypothetical protein